MSSSFVVVDDGLLEIQPMIRYVVWHVVCLLNYSRNLLVIRMARKNAKVDDKGK